MFVMSCDSLTDRVLFFLHLSSVSDLVGLDSSCVSSFLSDYTFYRQLFKKELRQDCTHSVRASHHWRASQEDRDPDNSTRRAVHSHRLLNFFALLTGLYTVSQFCLWDPFSYNRGRQPQACVPPLAWGRLITGTLIIIFWIIIII